MCTLMKKKVDKYKAHVNFFSFNSRSSNGWPQWLQSNDIPILIRDFVHKHSLIKVIS